MSLVLTDEQRIRIVESQDFWLATVRPSLAAHLVPMWAVLVNDVFYMGTGPNSQKMRNILAHPRAVLALPDTRNVFMVEGMIRRLSESAPDGVMDRFAEKYDWTFEPGGEWVVVEFIPEKIITWNS
ncbi:MAG: pyridoxamine 5'-phosphate oxidase family protein [Ardenticatenaceae bacterium]